MAIIEFAQQGVRQPACLQGEQLKILVAGAIFTAIGFPHCAKDLAIPKGCIGISEINSLGQVEAVSVIRDDCKAARKAIRAVETVTNKMPSPAHDPSLALDPKKGLERSADALSSARTGTSMMTFRLLPL